MAFYVKRVEKFLNEHPGIVPDVSLALEQIQKGAKGTVVNDDRLAEIIGEKNLEKLEELNATPAYQAIS